MSKIALMKEIRLLELRLQMLKVMTVPGKTGETSFTSADLYGLLSDSDDITPNDIDAVEIRMK